MADDPETITAPIAQHITLDRCACGQCGGFVLIAMDAEEKILAVAPLPWVAAASLRDMLTRLIEGEATTTPGQSAAGGLH